MLGALGFVGRPGPISTNQPSFDFRLLAGPLDSRMTFTRASSGSYTDITGTVKSAAVNTPRFDYDPVTHAPLGLLIEEQRTNLFTQSAIDTSWTVTGGTLTPAAATSPDGTVNAASLIQDTSTGEHRIQKIPAIAANVTYACGWFVKLINAQRYVNITLYDNTAPANSCGLTFDLIGLVTGGAFASGTASTPTGTITTYGNGFYRISITAQPSTAANTGVIGRLRLYNSMTVLSFTGDGVSGIYAWGGQIEAGSFSTSYIPTAGATATRASDLLTMPLASWASSTAFSLAAEYSLAQATNPSAFQRDVAGLFDATPNNQAVLRGQQASGNTAVILTQVAGGTATLSASLLTTTANAIEKIAGAWSSGVQRGCGNGGAIVTTNVAGIPAITTLAIGNDSPPGFLSLNGWVRRVRGEQSRAWTNAELQQVTT